MKAPLPKEASIITTYRCCMKCRMCDIWKHPTRIADEIRPEELEILPQLRSINVTGGEPFVRRDLADIVEVTMKKAERVVISTSGYHVDETLALAEKFPNIGIRVSLEGLSTTNDHLRGRDSGFDRGLRTLLGLRRMGVKDIGFGITVSNNNSSDMLELYELSKNLKMEFATASYHNSYYFHKEDNEITNKEEVESNFYELCDRLLAEKHPKLWFRAFFNMGLINYIEGKRRLLPCEAGTVNFFIDPYGEVYSCNGLEERYWKKSMGNIRRSKGFEEIWYSKEAEEVREHVATCPKNCWMIGTAAPVMKKYIKHPLKWVIKNKLNSLRGRKLERGCLPEPFDVGQSRLQGDLREEKAAPAMPVSTNGHDERCRSDLRMMTRVKSNETVLDNIFRLRVERRSFEFEPGQNVSIGLHLDYHRNRDFTICSGNGDDHLEFLIKEIPGGALSPVLRKLKKGDSVDLVGPYGEFTLLQGQNGSRKHLFIASGIGISPFGSFVKSFPGVDYQVIHGIRGKTDLVLSEGFDPERYAACFSQEEGGDFHGRVVDYLKEYTITAGTCCYVCGNPQMVSTVTALLEERGVPNDLIRTEIYYAY